MKPFLSNAYSIMYIQIWCIYSKHSIHSTLIFIVGWQPRFAFEQLDTWYILCTVSGVKEEAHRFFCWHRIYTLLWFPPLPFLSLRSDPRLTVVLISHAPGLQTLPSFLLHCTKTLAIFPSPAGMSLTKLSLAGNNKIILAQGEVWLVTSRLGTGISLTFFYSVLL